jgi:preprotein translocase subunit SecD
MLHFTRIQITAILVTVLVICGFAVPNFLSDETIEGWPDWAQRRITLAPELQGGTSTLLEVDRNDVRRHVLISLFRDVQGMVHDYRIHLANRPAIRGGGVEVKPVAGDFDAALVRFRGLLQTFDGVSPVEVTNAGDGLIRLTPTDAGIQEYDPPIANQSARTIRARLFGVARATVEREGANRVRVQVPRADLSRLKL